MEEQNKEKEKKENIKKNKEIYERYVERENKEFKLKHEKDEKEKKRTIWKKIEDFFEKHFGGGDIQVLPLKINGNNGNVVFHEYSKKEIEEIKKKFYKEEQQKQQWI